MDVAKAYILVPPMARLRKALRGLARSSNRDDAIVWVVPEAKVRKVASVRQGHISCQRSPASSAVYFESRNRRRPEIGKLADKESKKEK